MKPIHMEFMNELAELLKKYDIHEVKVSQTKLGVIEIGFDDYYDKLEFESFESGIFKNVTTTQDYKTE